MLSVSESCKNGVKEGVGEGVDIKLGRDALPHRAMYHALTCIFTGWTWGNVWKTEKKTRFDTGNMWKTGGKVGHMWISPDSHPVSVDVLQLVIFWDCLRGLISSLYKGLYLNSQHWKFLIESVFDGQKVTISSTLPFNGDLTVGGRHFIFKYYWWVL